MKIVTFRNLLTCILLHTAVCSTAPLYAKDQIDSISELSLEDLINIEVDIASTDKRNLQNTPSSVTVINSADLLSYNFLTLSEALESVVGVSIYRTYLKRDLPTTRGILQDIYANKTLILINKVPLWNAVTGEGSLERIAIGDIEQIEILKGPASVQYGTNAYSGVVNIVLKQKEQPGAEISGGVASFGKRSTGGNYSCTQGDLQVFVSASSTTGNGKPEEFTDEKGVSGKVKEYINSTALTANIAYLDHSLLINSFRSEESFLGFTPDYTSGIGFPHRIEGTMASYGYKHQYRKICLRASGIFDMQSRMMVRDQNNSVQANINGYQTSAGVAAAYRFNTHFNAELGVDNNFRKSAEYRNYNTQTGSTVDRLYDSVVFDGENSMSGVSMVENSAVLQVNYQSGRASGTAGCRYTDNSCGGHNISSNAAILFALSDNKSIKLIYGESFRAPSLFELYFKYPSVLGTKDLKPETCRSLELAYVYAAPKFFVQTLIYWARYDQKIYRKMMYDYALDGHVIKEITIYANGCPADAAGAEFEMSYRNPQIINLFCNLDYVKGISSNTNQDRGNDNFSYISNCNISAGVSKSIGIVTLSAVTNYYSPSQGQYQTIPQQYTADISAGTKHKLWGKAVSHTIYVKNIADHQRAMPEYVRFRALNEIPSGYGRSIGYSFLFRL